MRAFAVGKEITFVPAHALPPNDDTQRDLGSAEIKGLDLSSELLKNGWAKVKDSKRGEPTEDELKKRELEAEAKAAGKGIWNPHGPKVLVSLAPLSDQISQRWVQSRTVHHSMPADSQVFLAEWKGKNLDGAHHLSPMKIADSQARDCRKCSGWHNLTHSTPHA